jgi:hypothetical protein
MNCNDNRNCERLADFIIDLTSHTEIISHDKGKIRLKVSLAAYSMAMKGVDGINLTEALDSFTGIDKYDFSFLWRTLDIDYDTSQIPGRLWEDMVNGGGAPSMRPQTRQSLIALLNGNSD